MGGAGSLGAGGLGTESPVVGLGVGLFPKGVVLAFDSLFWALDFLRSLLLALLAFFFCLMRHLKSSNSQGWNIASASVMDLT